MALFTGLSTVIMDKKGEAIEMRSPITYFGGKGRIVKRLLPFIPSHRQYVEVFGGGASLLFAKEPAKVETYNDIDQDVVNFFRVLRSPEKFTKFYHKVCLTPYSRIEYYEAKERLKYEIDPIKRAYFFFIRSRMCLGGDINGGWGFNLKQSGGGKALTCNRWLSTLELLPVIVKRLMTVQIECNDFRKVMKTHDIQDTFFYLDPPYLPKTRRTGRYSYEMSEEDHKDLIEILIHAKGKIMLSGYPNELYDSLHWNKKCFPGSCSAVGRTRSSKILGKGSAIEKQPRTECIWMNYKIEQNPSLFKNNG